MPSNPEFTLTSSGQNRKRIGIELTRLFDYGDTISMVKVLTEMITIVKFAKPTKKNVTAILTPIANKLGLDIIVMNNVTGNNFRVRQTELTDAQLRQQDAVDEMVLEMINVTHDALGLDLIDDDIDAIASARDVLVKFLHEQGLIDERAFYPYLED